jgi:hypothetical protein
MQRSFTCCVGSGMESHALHGLGVWSESDDTIWLNLFAPSTAECMDGAVRPALDTDFPEGENATLRLTLVQPREFTLAVRRPVWAGDAFTIALNGRDIPQPTLASLHDPVAGGRAGGLGNEAVDGMASRYVEIRRTWSTGDTITLHLPKSLRLEPTKDDPTVTAIMWGPLVLAGDHGPRRQGRGGDGDELRVPVLVSATRAPDEFIVPGSRPGDFIARNVARMPGLADSRDIALAPFYRTHRRSYSVYVDLLTPDGYDAYLHDLEDARAAEARLEAATIARVVPDSASEREANYRSEPADRQVTRNSGRAARGGSGWFSYEIAADANAPIDLVVTYRNDPGLPPLLGPFDILVDGERVAPYAPNHDAIAFYDARYPVPESLTRGKPRVTVRFDAGAAGRIIPVYSVRTVRRTP